MQHNCHLLLSIAVLADGGLPLEDLSRCHWGPGRSHVADGDAAREGPTWPTYRQQAAIPFHPKAKNYCKECESAGANVGV
jgi:hypothetical protein